ncbi:hypothetical protein [Rosenbergiella nectarea]|uniref:hypothetical protein n=1 Tax=Rosenbergiella nectarea TaxID=988801 RepID=UPI001F4E338C|nr:hypothetical protein [Rosenbergiella nectarea]
MADFKNSFKAGVESALVADNNKKEIQDLIEEVNSQITESYEGKVHFGVWNLTRTSKNRKNIFSSITDPLSIDITSYKALCISDYNNKSPIELAEWKVDENGYPCMVKHDDRESYCFNKEELISEISSLLSSVKTGNAILEKLKFFSERGSKES